MSSRTHNLVITDRGFQILTIVLLLITLPPVFASHNDGRNPKGSTSNAQSQQKSSTESQSSTQQELDARQKRQKNIDLLDSIGQAPEKSKLEKKRQLPPMTLEVAEELALRNDPLILRIKSMQESLEQKAQAAFSWPDPKLKIAALNVPNSTWDFDTDPLSQKVIGIVQEFPPYGAVAAKRDQIMAMSNATYYQYENRRLDTLRSIRRHWLTVHKHYQTRKLLLKSIDIFTQFKKITRLQYRAGRGKQQDVLRAQLEESLLLDRKVEVTAEYEKAIAQLRKSLNISLFKRNLEMAFPTIKNPPSESEIRQNLDHHPWFMVGETYVKAAKSGVQSANAQFKPGWSLDLSYGQRNDLHDDLVSAVILFDLPIFRGGRQSRQLQSSQSALTAAKYDLDDRQREIHRRLEESLSAYTRANERLKLYTELLLPQAEQNTESSLSAYQSGVNTFGVLVRARLIEMDSRIQFIKLKVDKAFAKIELLYLAGAQ